MIRCSGRSARGTVPGNKASKMNRSIKIQRDHYIVYPVLGTVSFPSMEYNNLRQIASRNYAP